MKLFSPEKRALRVVSFFFSGSLFCFILKSHNSPYLQYQIKMNQFCEKLNKPVQPKKFPESKNC